MFGEVLSTCIFGRQGLSLLRLLFFFLFFFFFCFLVVLVLFVAFHVIDILLGMLRLSLT